MTNLCDLTIQTSNSLSLSLSQMSLDILVSVAISPQNSSPPPHACVCSIGGGKPHHPLACHGIASHYPHPCGCSYGMYCCAKHHRRSWHPPSCPPTPQPPPQAAIEHGRYPQVCGCSYGQTCEPENHHRRLSLPRQRITNGKEISNIEAGIRSSFASLVALNKPTTDSEFHHCIALEYRMLEQHREAVKLWEEHMKLREEQSMRKRQKV